MHAAIPLSCRTGESLHRCGRARTLARPVSDAHRTSRSSCDFRIPDVCMVPCVSTASRRSQRPRERGLKVAPSPYSIRAACFRRSGRLCGSAPGFSRGIAPASLHRIIWTPLVVMISTADISVADHDTTSPGLCIADASKSLPFHKIMPRI
jgi:hypothetical protein